MAEQPFVIRVNGKDVFETKAQVQSCSVKTARGELGHLRFGEDPAVYSIDLDLVYEGTLNKTLRQEEEEARNRRREEATARQKQAEENETFETSSAATASEEEEEEEDENSSDNENDENQSNDENNDETPSTNFGPLGQ